jgi:hypothetical protein
MNVSNVVSRLLNPRHTMGYLQDIVLTIEEINSTAKPIDNCNLVYSLRYDNLPATDDTQSKIDDVNDILKN